MSVYSKGLKRQRLDSDLNLSSATDFFIDYFLYLTKTC